MTGLDELKNALVTTGLPVSHGHAHQQAVPCIIWMEAGTRDMYAGDQIVARIAYGAVALYYTGEADDLINTVHNAILSVGCCSLDSNQYVEDLDVNECLWNFEVIL